MCTLMHSYTYIVTIHNKHIPYISNQTKKYLSSLKPWSRVRVHMYISLTYSTHGRESNILTMHILQLRRLPSNMCMKIMMINSNLKRLMHHALSTERGHICARVKREGPFMGFRCGFCVLFNRCRRAGTPSSSFNNSLFYHHATICLLSTTCLE